MNKPTSLPANFLQLCLFFILEILIIVFKFPVVKDYYQHKINIRTIDGWGDGMANMLFFVIGFVIFLTLKKNKNYVDFYILGFGSLLLFMSIFIQGTSQFQILVFGGCVINALILYRLFKK